MIGDKKHIVLTGPESSGKTTLFDQLKLHYEATFIDEFARKFLQQHDNKYSRNDLRTIAFQQFQQQLSAYNTDHNLIISDTDLLSIVIWDEYKYGQMDDFILEWFQLQQVDLYVLCKPDLIWEPDPMRENEYDRDVLYRLYKRKIQDAGIPFVEIDGQGQSRYVSVDQAIRSFLQA